MTDEQLNEIEQCANAATPGPWTGYPSMISISPAHALSVFMRENADPLQVERDIDFISHARTDVPALVAALRDERNKLRSDIERIGRERDLMIAANVELQERANETHAALRTMAQSWLTMAASYDASPRQQGEADTLKQCAHHLARMWDAATHPIEPVEAK